MMLCCKRLIRPSGLILLIFLSACTQSYSVFGQFEGSGDTFFGTVSAGMSQSGTINVSTRDGSVKCTGTSEVMKLPSGYSSIGAQGRAMATCSDGRSFKVDFIQNTESGGRGQGIDSRGEIVQIFFDLSDGLAQSMLNQHLLNTLIK